MNDLPHATIGDNSEKKFNEFNAKFDLIDQSVRVAHTRLMQHNKALFSALGETLELGRLIASRREDDRDADWSFLKSLLEHHRRKWSSKCEKNFFHELVSIGFDKLDGDGQAITSEPNMSKYRMILRHAFERDWDGGQLVDELNENSLTGLYEDAVAEARKSPLDKFLENTQDRFERATRTLLDRPGLPSGEWTNEVPRPENGNEFASAVLYLTDDGFQIVDVDTAEPAEDIKAKVASLVAAQAVRSSERLADQPFYWLFVACDFYSRFMPGLGSDLGFAKLEAEANAPELGMSPTDDELVDYLEAMSIYSKERDQKRVEDEARIGALSGADLSKKFVLLNALVLCHDGTNWIVESRSTLSHTISTRSVHDVAVEHLPTSKSHWVKPGSVGQFVSDFPAFENWQVKRDAEVTTICASSDQAQRVLLADYSLLGNWRQLDPALTAVCRFRLTKNVLEGLAGWRSDFKAQNSFTHQTFQPKMKLEIDDKTLTLSFPNNPRQRRTFGEFISGSVPSDAEERFVEFSFVEELIRWSKDYGTTFEIDLMAGHQGWTALCVEVVGHPFEISMTAPMLLSHKGAPTEINLPPQSSPLTDDIERDQGSLG